MAKRALRFLLPKITNESAKATPGSTQVAWAHTHQRQCSSRPKNYTTCSSLLSSIILQPQAHHSLGCFLPESCSLQMDPDCLNTTAASATPRPKCCSHCSIQTWLSYCSRASIRHSHQATSPFGQEAHLGWCWHRTTIHIRPALATSFLHCQAPTQCVLSSTAEPNYKMEI